MLLFERALVFLKTCHSIFGLDEISELKIIKRVKNLSDAKQPGTLAPVVYLAYYFWAQVLFTIIW